MLRTLEKGRRRPSPRRGRAGEGECVAESVASLPSNQRPSCDRSTTRETGLKNRLSPLPDFRRPPLLTGPASSADFSLDAPPLPPAPPPFSPRVIPETLAGSPRVCFRQVSGRVDPGAPPPSWPWGSPRGRSRAAGTARLPRPAQPSGPAPKSSRA